MMLNRICQILLALSTLWTCSAFASASASLLDVNDSTFIFPTDSISNDPFPSIHVDESLTPNGKPILSRELFKSVLDGQVNMINGLDRHDFDRLRVISFRYDPCFPGPQTDSSKCIQQIRLVVQPINSEVGADDFSLHLFYEMGRGLPRADDWILRSLVRLKATGLSEGARTSGVSLGIHPALQSEMESQRAKHFSNDLKQFLLSTISKGTLTEIASTGGDADANQSDGSWIFQKGAVKGTRWIPLKIPRLDQISQESNSFGILDGFPQVRPQVYPIFESKTGSAQKSAPSLEVRQSDMAVIMNPRLTNPGNMDCVSCHIASQVDRSISVEVLQEQNALRSLKPVLNQFKAAPGITSSVDRRLQGSDAPQGFQNVRVIGRLQKDIQVNQLAVNSAALVTETLNHILQGQ